MKVKRNNDKSIEEIREIAFWKISFKKSMDKKWKKNVDKAISSFINYSNNSRNDHRLEHCLKPPLDSDNESISNNSSEKSKDDDVEPEENSKNQEQLIKQLDILSFESDEDEVITEEEEEDAFTAFSKLNLVSNAAHLSVFVNFTIVHSVSEYILFYLITNLYANGSVKDMKKWAYEIYSSFLAPFSPLKILDTIEHATILNDIEKKLSQISNYDPVDSISSSYNFQMLRLTREIFFKARVEVEKVITKQLAEFQSKRKAGLETMYGASSGDLKAAKKNKKMQQIVIEKNLMPKLLQMLEDLEENDENACKMILVSALSTVIHQTFNPRTTYFEPINQFVARSDQSTKIESFVKGHRLVPKTCYSSTNCDFCLNVFWGLSPQAYECDCGIKIHESCIQNLKGMCILHKDDAESDSEINDTKDSIKLMELVHKALGNRHIENYKRSKGERPKSDPGLYNLSSYQHSSDSSDDGNLDESIWSTDVSFDFKKLSDDERKRREIIMELFETERRHIKTLKVLQNVFLEPLKRTKALSPELESLLFPSSFFIIKDWHMSFEAMLKKEWQEQHGTLLEIGNCLSIFEEPYRKIIKENAASFCAGQKHALETLRITRSKNDTLQRALIKSESHKRCKRLQLKDLMLSILQRITKYPLLFERILKYSSGIEYEKVKAALASSKLILNHVNDVIKQSEELQSIQIKLDVTNFTKECPMEFRKFNLLDYKLIYDGCALMKKCPMVLRVLLFEKIIVFLHKQDDKYFLKSCESMKLPIVKLHRTIVRPNAIDCKSFFLISQTDNDSQMLEINTFTETECQTWILKISNAIEKVNEKLKIKRNPSAESAQSMLRHESKINLPMTKHSELATISQALYTQAKHIEEWVNAAQRNLNCDSQGSESKDADTISICLSTFNCLISQLTIKIAERDHEREIYLKENQRLREQKKL